VNIPNSAAINAMTDTERTIYNWGLEDGKEWYLQVGKTEERLRILDILTENLPAVMLTEIRKQIKGK